MLILTIRTDNPEAELGLFEDGRKMSYAKWPAHRQLAETIHQKLKSLLDNQSKHYEDIDGIVVYKGPGSFTGLRIGLSVSNALADSLKIPIAGSGSDNWLENGISRLLKGDDDKQVIPEYGAPPHITRQRK